MAVRFDRVKHDLLFGAPRFETFCVEELFGAVPANSFRDVSPKRREFTELLPWVFVRASVNDGAEVRGDDDVVYWYSFSNHYTKRAFTQP